MRFEPADLPPSVPPGRPARRVAQRVPLWVFVFSVLTIALSGGGFIFKLVEFVRAYGVGGEVDFAIVPLACYLSVAAGYLFIFLWAFSRGMFRDVERPKFRMLELQDEIDAREGWRNFDGPGTAPNLSVDPFTGASSR